MKGTRHIFCITFAATCEFIILTKNSSENLVYNLLED